MAIRLLLRCTPVASSRSPRVTIHYVDGTDQTGSWSELDTEGVDRVSIHTATGTISLASASLYWMYAEEECWVAGWGSVRYDPNPLTEIVIAPDGSQTERGVPFMPDLRLRDVKLGWWWPGKERPDG